MLRPRDSRSPHTERTEGRSGCSAHRHWAFPSASLQRPRVISFRNHPGTSRSLSGQQLQLYRYSQRDKDSLKAPGYKYLRNTNPQASSGGHGSPAPRSLPTARRAGPAGTAVPVQGGCRRSPTWATTCSCARRGRSCGGHRSSTWRPGSRSSTRRGRRRSSAGSWTRLPAPCRRWGSCYTRRSWCGGRPPGCPAPRLRRHPGGRWGGKREELGRAGGPLTAAKSGAGGGRGGLQAGTAAPPHLRGRYKPGSGGSRPRPEVKERPERLPPFGGVGVGEGRGPCGADRPRGCSPQGQHPSISRWGLVFPQCSVPHRGETSGVHSQP